MDQSGRCLASVLLLAAAVVAAPASAQRGADIPAIEKRMRAFQAAGDQASALGEARKLESAVKVRFGANHQNYAIVLNNLGSISEEQGSYTAAEGYYWRALALLDRMPRTKDAEAAANLASDLGGTLTNLATVYKGQGRYAEAEAAQRRALGIQEQAFGANDVKVAKTLGSLAVVLRSQNRLAEAEEALLRARAIQEKAAASQPPQTIALAETLSTLATVYEMQGKRSEAEALLKRSLGLRETMPGARPTGVASTLVNLAALYGAQGRQAEAAEMLQKALVLNESFFGAGHPNVAVVLNNLGVVYENLGRHADAEGLQKRALAIREKVGGPASADVAQSLTNLSVVYRAQGRNAEAAEVIERAIAIWQKTAGTDHPVMAGSLENLAIAQQAQGKFREAEAALRRALAIQEKVLGPSHTDLSGTLNNLAIVENKLGRQPEAIDATKRALAIQEAALGAFHPDLIATLNNLAAVQFESGQKQQALDASRRMSEVILAQVPIAEAGSPGGGVEWLGQYTDYFGRYVAHLASVQRVTREPALGREAFRVAQLTVQSAAAGALQQTNARVAAGDAELAVLVRENQDLAVASREKDKALIAALAQPGSGQGRKAVALIRDEAAGLKARITANEAVLDQSFPAYAALAHPKPMEADAVQDLLGRDEALVFMIVGEAGTFIFALNREDFAWQGIRFGSDALAERVAAFRGGLDVEKLRQSIDAGKPELFDLFGAYDLYDTLLGPIEAVIKDKKHLLVVASGPLTSLPFHLLVTERPDQAKPTDLAGYAKAAWLSKRQAVSVLPSVDSLGSLRAVRPRETSAKPLVAFADPVFQPAAVTAGVAKPTQVAAARSKSPSRGYGEFWKGAGVDRDRLAEALPPLPETADEVKAVAAKLGAEPGDLYLGEAASEANVKSVKLADYRVVYFATHGLVAGDVKGVAEPALALTLPATPSARDDGLLTASEVSQLTLGADWVVLSACNTASGDKPGADALSGLARAFFYAGSRALLVSHWAVDSDSATRLTTSTFGILGAEPGIGRAEAVRRAMLAYMSDGANPRNAYPAYWGPFSVIGEGAGR